ncbi:MAG: hypothetical protein OdinLCB4_002985 [Candidatus Odinarchaeum yellowstonii]|jgi:hypothetical protein|uniref:Uncharacterized protein n=1 Tax=Odinarchaeota yellowstonii (strain LCB_4) TaxID=1841599 RepID=A0AAF0D3C5_ODILC|nr:MAG: hypothetical protein OdinLCB4_002985 [Candidatus Odinarchaeum yellowstonii]
MSKEEKKKGKAEQAGEAVGKGLKKGWDVAKSAGRGLKKGLKREEEEED